MTKDAILAKIRSAYASRTDIQFPMASMPEGITVKDLADEIKTLTGKDVSAALDQAKAGKKVFRLPFSTLKPPTVTVRERAIQAAGYLPAAGAMVGGIAGSAAAIPAAGVTAGVAPILAGMKGAALGGATGEAARQLAVRALGANAPATLGGAALRIAGAGTLGGLTEGAGGLAMKVGGKVIAPFAATIKESMPRMVDIANKIGLKLTPADINKNLWLKRFEDLMADTWIGAEKMGEVRGAQIEAVRNAGLGLRSKFGTKMNNEEVSRMVTEEIVKKSKAENELVKEIYAQRDKLINMSKEVPLKNTLATSNAIQSAEQRAIIKGDADLVALAKNLSMTGSPQGTQKATFKTISDAITKLNDKIAAEHAIALQGGMQKVAGQATQKERLLLRLKSAMQKDMDNFLKTQAPEAQALNTLAKKKYTDFAQVFKSDEIRALADKDPQAIIKYLINAGRVKEFDMVKRAIGERGMEPVRKRFFQDVIEKAVPEEGALNINAIDAAFKQYRPEIIARIMNPEAVKELKDISFLVKNLATQGKMKEKAASYGVVANLTSAALLKMYSTDRGRKLLIEGLRTPTKKAAAITSGRIAQFLAMSGITPDTQIQDKGKLVLGTIKEKYW